MQQFWERVVRTVEGFGWEERLVIGLVGLAVFTAISVYVVRRVRSGITAPRASVSEHLTEFRRLRDLGQIDDQEFSRVVNAVSQQESSGLPAKPARPPEGAPGAPNSASRE